MELKASCSWVSNIKASLSQIKHHLKRLSHYSATSPLCERLCRSSSSWEEFLSLHQMEFGNGIHKGCEQGAQCTQSAPRWTAPCMQGIVLTCFHRGKQNSFQTRDIQGKGRRLSSLWMPALAKASTLPFANLSQALGHTTRSLYSCYSCSLQGAGSYPAGLSQPHTSCCPFLFICTSHEVLNSDCIPKPLNHITPATPVVSKHLSLNLMSL